jgi:hypothetical protein
VRASWRQGVIPLPPATRPMDAARSGPPEPPSVKSRLEASAEGATERAPRGPDTSSVSPIFSEAMYADSLPYKHQRHVRVRAMVRMR